MLGKATKLKESDSALMLSFAAGDGEGFDLLYKRHAESVYRFFFFGTHGDETLTAELYQDVWLTVVRGRARYTNEISFTDWLYHSAWARLHDHIRLHPLDSSVDTKKDTFAPSNVVQLNRDCKAEEDQVDANSTVDEIAEPSDDSPAVKATDKNSVLLDGIKNMSPEHKEVVLLRFCFSMCLQDIADFLDVSKPTVDRCFNEAVRILRADLTTKSFKA